MSRYHYIPLSILGQVSRWPPVEPSHISNCHWLSKFARSVLASMMCLRLMYTIDPKPAADPQVAHRIAKYRGLPPAILSCPPAIICFRGHRTCGSPVHPRMIAGAFGFRWWCTVAGIFRMYRTRGFSRQSTGPSSGGRRGLKCSFKAVKEQRTTLLFKENTEMVIFAVSKMSLAETKSQRVTKSQKSRRKRSHICLTSHSHKSPDSTWVTWPLQALSHLGSWKCPPQHTHHHWQVHLLLPLGVFHSI
jgi:hypothetical protein